MSFETELAEVFAAHYRGVFPRHGRRPARALVRRLAFVNRGSLYNGGTLLSVSLAFTTGERSSGTPPALRRLWRCGEGGEDVLANFFPC